MKKKKVIVITSCILASVAMAFSCILFSKNETLKTKGSDEFYSITIDAAEKAITDSTTEVSGSFVAKTDQNKNNITFLYENLTYNEAPKGVYLQGNGYGHIYNSIGHEVRGMRSIIIKGDNSAFTVRWGYQEGSSINYVDYLWKYASPSGTEYDFGDDKPNFFKIESGAKDAPMVYEIVITYGAECEVGENPYVIEDGIKYKKIDDDHYSVLGFSGASRSNVELPETIHELPVSEISEKAFKEDSLLTSINLTHIEKVGDGAFALTKLNAADTLENLQEIGADAFEYSNLSGEISFGDNIRSIGETAFYGCNEVTSVRFSDLADDPEVDSSSFRAMAKLESFHIGSGCEDSFYCDFYNMPKLSSVTVGDGNDCFDTSTGAIIRNGRIIRLINASSVTTWVMPEDIIDVDDYFAEDHSYLESVTINDEIDWIPNYSFSDCEKLETVVIGSGVTDVIGYNCFKGCISLTYVTFKESAATSQTLTIRDNAFEGCSALPSIVLPERVCEIGSEAFKNCTSLVNFRYEGTVTEWNSIIKGSDWNDGLGATEVVCSDDTVTL